MTTPLPDKVLNYLNKYSEPERLLKLKKPSSVYNNIIVIPAIDEYNNLQNLISSLEKIDNKYFNESLFIFVINNTANASTEVKENNRLSFEYLNSLKSKLNIYIIDAFSDENELPEKTGGVGLARKTGMDFALTLFDYNNNKKKILICLDADCTVSNNYLTDIVERFNKDNLSAASLRFEHSLSGEHLEAIVCYELFLRYYVAGLKFANSYYAFHTVGSSMVCDFENYIKIEGMNKRKAAEDFYFLEKLAKNCEITSIKEVIVYPSSRPSMRVPFGTGQRVNRYYQQTQDEYVLYPFESFIILKKWLQIFNNDSLFISDEYLSKAKEININLHNFLIEQDFAAAWDKIIKHSGGKAQIKKQKLYWFDGFRTLKLIHYLRDNLNGNNNMFAAVSELLSECGIKHKQYVSGIPEVSFQIEYLNILKQID